MMAATGVDKDRPRAMTSTTYLGLLLVGIQVLGFVAAIHAVLTVRTALGRFRLPYLTVTPTFSICPRHGYLAGEHEFCPKCDEELLQRSTPKSCCGGCGG